MSAEPRATDVVEHEVTVAASPETVFSYFTDPAKMVEWMGVEATLDPRPGGLCRIAFRPAESMVELLDSPFGPEQQRALDRLDPGGARVMSGEFVEVDPPRRLVLAWGWEEKLYAVPPQSSAVEVSLAPERGSTILRLVHRRLPAEATPLHRVGWAHYLGRLAVAAGDGEPGPDPWQA